MSEKVLSGYGIHTIGELAATSDDFLKCRLGKNGLAIKKYSMDWMIRRLCVPDYVSPVKSIGHGITTMQDLENNAEVWCVIWSWCRKSEPSCEHKEDPTYLAKTAFALFARNYQYEHPIRSVTVRAINLFEGLSDIDLFTDVKNAGTPGTSGRSD